MTVYKNVHIFLSNFYKKTIISPFFCGPPVRASRTPRGPRTTVWETLLQRNGVPASLLVKLSQALRIVLEFVFLFLYELLILPFLFEVVFITLFLQLSLLLLLLLRIYEATIPNGQATIPNGGFNCTSVYGASALTSWLPCWHMVNMVFMPISLQHPGNS